VQPPRSRKSRGESVLERVGAGLSSDGSLTRAVLNRVPVAERTKTDLELMPIGADLGVSPHAAPFRVTVPSTGAFDIMIDAAEYVCSPPDYAAAP
jgi:hypothetical protein